MFIGPGPGWQCWLDGHTITIPNPTQKNAIKIRCLSGGATPYDDMTTNH